MKKLLFTGASGFLGNNLKPILSQTYSIKTLGLTDEDDIKINLAQAVPQIIDSFDIVLHAAGKAHTVPRTEAEKKVFFDVNYQQ
jgi:nucleoside-diphosphate-sugar epimerase